MPDREPLRTEVEAKPSKRSRRGTGTSARSQPIRRRGLSHVHSFHLDDQSVYQDHHHQNAGEDEEAIVDGETGDLEKGSRKAEKERGFGRAEQEDTTSDDSQSVSWLDSPREKSEKVDSESVSWLDSREDAEHSPQLDREKTASTTRAQKPDLKKSQSSKSVRDPNLVTWDGPDDPANPKNWSKKQKWFATFIVSSFTFISPVASSMVAPALSSMAKDFGVTNEVQIQLMLSIFILAYAIGPLFLGPLSELYGRVPVLQLANMVYLIFNAACGGAKNSGMMIGFRFLAGLGGSAPLAIGGGVLSDAWKADERGAAIAVYSLMPLLGPAIGPIAGGFITENTTWRWAFYATSIADALIQIVGLFALRETYPPAILAKKVRKLRKETGNDKLYTEYDHPDRALGKHLATAFSRPFKMLFTQPIVQVLALYMAYLYGIMYLLLSTFPMVWTEVYGESISIGSLNYISLGFGFSMGTQICARLQDRVYKRLLTQRNNGTGKPEYRVPLMFPGSLLIPAGLFIYGWSAHYKTHWIVPNIGAAIFGFGSIMCFQCIQTYAVDAYTRYAASAIGAITVLRSLAGFGFPLFAPYMYSALGLGWGNSLLGFLALGIGIPAPMLLWMFGERLRKKSPFAAGGGF